MQQKELQEACQWMSAKNDCVELNVFNANCGLQRDISIGMGMRRRG